MGTTVTSTRRQLLLVVALTLAFTAFALETVPATGTPTEMWASVGATFIWTSLVWDGRSRPTVVVGLHVVAQCGLFVVIATAYGWGTVDTLWMGAANVGAGLAMLVLYAHIVAGPGLAPRTAVGNVQLLLASVAATSLVVVLGGYPGLDVGQFDRLTLWWVIRSVVYTYVGAVTLLSIFDETGRSLEPSPRWATPSLMSLGVAGVFVTYYDPTLPLTWSMLFPAVLAGSILSIRGTAYYTLFVALISALATLHPINQFGYEGFLPGSIIIDLLITAATFIAIHLAILRFQRIVATTELEQQRGTTEEQNELLRTTFESMSDGLVVLDEQEQVVLHNAAARQLLGRRIPLGEPVDWIAHFGLLRLDGEDLTLEELAESATADGRFHRQLRIENETARRVLDIDRRPLSGPGRSVVLFSDVTTQSERLSELTGFAGVVAHDLRSPLASLHGWLEMAEDSLHGSDRTRTAEFLTRAQLSSVRMRQVIEDWLAYTVQRDGLLTRADVELPTVLDEIVASYGEASSGTSPDFQVLAHHTVEADRVLTKQLLANLIGNAVKYSPEGERPRVEIRSFLDAERGFVRIEVTDRGIGLPDGEQEQVFEEFHRAPAHAQIYAGTGLGLSLCRRIVQRHGGSISARNNPDRGATFSFTLPAAEWAA